MKGRGEAARRETKLEILRALLECDCHTAGLAVKTDTSRQVVSELLEELISIGAVERKGERAFSLCEGICFVLLKIFDNSAEVVTFFCDTHSVERKTINFIASMSYIGNVARTASLVERHLDRLQRDGKTVYAATIGVNREIDVALPKVLSLTQCKSKLIERFLRTRRIKETVLYLDTVGGGVYLYSDATYVGSGCGNAKELLPKIDNAFSFLLPDTIMLESDSSFDSERIESVCNGRSVRLVPIMTDRLTLDEIGMMNMLVEWVLKQEN